MPGGPARCVAAGLAAGAVLAAPAAAHPHGRLDCAVAVRLAAADAGAPPLAVDLSLTMDAASSAALAPRLQLEQPTPAREALGLRAVIDGLLRQSGWMLVLRAGADAPPLALSQQGDTAWSATADGRVQLRVQLQGSPSPGLDPRELDLRCQDPTWYWLPTLSQVTARAAPGRDCAVTLGDWQVVGDRARAAQAEALRQGLPQADRMAPGLGEETARAAMQARLHCG